LQHTPWFFDRFYARGRFSAPPCQPTLQLFSIYPPTNSLTPGIPRSVLRFPLVPPTLFRFFDASQSRPFCRTPRSTPCPRYFLFSVLTSLQIRVTTPLLSYLPFPPLRSSFSSVPCYRQTFLYPMVEAPVSSPAGVPVSVRLNGMVLPAPTESLSFRQMCLQTLPGPLLRFNPHA